MEKFSVLLMIAAIICILLVDKIDMTRDKNVRKVIVVFSVAVILICTITIAINILV